MSEIQTITYQPTEICAYAQCFGAPFVAINGMLTMGQVLTKGTALGIVTSTGKYVAYASTNSDGSQTCVGILDRDVDASDKDHPITLFVMGFFYNALLTGVDSTAITNLGAKLLPGGILKVG
jgi:hypothetical protein